MRNEELRVFNNLMIKKLEFIASNVYVNTNNNVCDFILLRMNYVWIFSAGCQRENPTPWNIISPGWCAMTTDFCSIFESLIACLVSPDNTTEQVFFIQMTQHFCRNV